MSFTPTAWPKKPLSVAIPSLLAGVSVNSVEEIRPVFGHGKFILKTSCVSGGKFIPSECKEIIPSDLKRAKVSPCKDSIIISRMNTPALVGECGHVDRNFDDLFLPDRLWLTKPSEDARWLTYLLSFGPWAKAIKDSATGTSNSMKNISKSSLLSIEIPLPKIEEQKKISNALSDIDALIDSLEKLIAKKRLIKKGAMQELLTGRRRLPEFGEPAKLRKTELGVIPDDWVIKLLPDVCKFRSGKAHEQFIVESGKYVCVNSKFISTDGKVRKHSSANFCPARTNDILMVMSDLPNGRALAKVFIADKDDFYAVNQRVCALTPYKDDPKFLALQLNRNPYFLKFDDGVSQTHLLNKIFEKCPVFLPARLEEQKAISEIISNMGTEIDALENKLEKAQLIKQGMMQQLLTGRIRLI